MGGREAQQGGRGVGQGGKGAKQGGRGAGQEGQDKVADGQGREAEGQGREAKGQRKWNLRCGSRPRRASLRKCALGVNRWPVGTQEAVKEKKEAVKDQD